MFLQWEILKIQMFVFSWRRIKIFDFTAPHISWSPDTNGASDGTGWCESVLPEQVLGGVADGSSCGRSSAHVGDPLQSVDGVVFGRVVVQAEL